MGNKIVFLSRVVDFEILRDFFYGSTELISKEGKFVERFFFLIFCCIWRVLRIYIGEGKGEIWHVNSIRYRAFIIVGTMNVFLESVMLIDDRTFKRFRRGFWISWRGMTPIMRIHIDERSVTGSWFCIRQEKKNLFFKKLSRFVKFVATLYSYVQVKANNFLGYELNFTFTSNDRNKIAFNWINKYTCCERQTVLLFSYIWTYNNYSSNVFHWEYIVQNDVSN